MIWCSQAPAAGTVACGAEQELTFVPCVEQPSPLRATSMACRVLLLSQQLSRRELQTCGAVQLVHVALWNQLPEFPQDLFDCWVATSQVRLYEPAHGCPALDWRVILELVWAYPCAHDAP